MPIILTVDGPSLGGFVSFATIATCEQWKIGQARPGDHIQFVKISLDDALVLKQWQETMIENIAPDYC
jgi:allophanate hydrolase subunit 2